MGSSMHLTIGTQSGTADHYQLDKSADNVTWTNNVGTVAYGVGNFVVPTVGYYYRITGVDSGGVPLTLVSNSQQVPY